MPRPKKKQKVQLERTFRIFCEGAKTEPYYIKGYLRNFREDNKASIEVMDCNKNTPVQLVEAAIKFKASNRSIKGDEFWVVYDREAVTKYPRALHLKAWDKAKAKSINVALSNVCFEHWLLLHFVDSAGAYSSFADLKEKSALEDEVQKVCPGPYDKASTELFEHIKSNIEVAKLRADSINRRGFLAAGHQNLPFDINPYSGIPDLLRAIDDF